MKSRLLCVFALLLTIFTLSGGIGVAEAQTNNLGPCGLSQNCTVSAVWSASAQSSGTNNAQIVTTNTGDFTLQAGNAVTFIPGSTNTGATTVNVDGQGAIAVHFNGSGVPSGALVVGVATQLVYNGSTFDLPTPSIEAIIGVLPAANGGTGEAGTITGALKGNGTSAVTQAAAADLTNGVTGTGAVPLASGGVVSSTVATATGSNTARTLAARMAEVFNVLDYGASPANTAAQNSAAFQAATTAACSSTIVNAEIYVPAGTYNVDVSSTPFDVNCIGVSIIGAGVQSTQFIVSGTGTLIHYSKPTGQPFGGGGTIYGFRAYRHDNPTSGAHIYLDHVQEITLNNLQLDGAFTDLHVYSSISLRGSQLFSIGDNTASGASMWLFDHNPGDSNNSEIFFNGFDLRGASGQTVQNAIVIGNVDGLFLNNGHVGFTSAEAVLVTPDSSSSAVDGIKFTGVDFDTATYGLRFTPLGGYTGSVNSITISNGLCEIVSVDCIRVDDTSVAQVSISGEAFVDAQHSAINLQGGTGYSISGGAYSSSNQAASTFPHILIGGSASKVAISGAAFIPGNATAQNDIQIAGTADYVSVGNNVHFGSTAIPVVSTSSGTHISVSSGVSSFTSIPWPDINVPSVGTLNIDAQLGSSGTVNIGKTNGDTINLPSTNIGPSASPATESTNTAGGGDTHYAAAAANQNWVDDHLVSRGTVASPTILGSADLLSSWRIKGYDGAAYNNVAAMRVNTCAAVSLGVVPGCLSIWTTNASGTFTFAGEFDQAQRWLIGYTGDQGGGEKLQVNGNAFVNGYVKATSVTDTGLTASQPVYTDAGKGLTSTAPAGYSAVLAGTSASLGGGALLAGACTSGTVSITGATTAMGVVVTPSAYPGDAIYWKGYVSSSNTVTVDVCAAIGATPSPETYNVRVLQ